MKKLWFLVLLLTMAGMLMAQLTEYSFASSSGSYVEITGGTVLGNATTDDQRFVDPAVPLGGTTNTGIGLPIGFTFTLNGISFDRFAVNANGWISLGYSSNTPAVNINSSSAYTPLASTTAITPADLVSRIALFGRDLNAQTGAELRYETIGTAPNRVLVVQWKNYRKYSTSSIDDSWNGQIRLYETSNEVKLVYGTVVNNATSTTVHVGLRGAPATTASNFSSRTSTTSWIASTASSTAAGAMTLSNTVFPASGLTYTWAPPVAGVAPNPANLVSPANSGTNVALNATLNWASGGGLPNGYRLSFGTNNPPTNILNSSDLANVTTYTPTTPLIYNQTYYWQIVPYNTNGDATACPVWSFTTMPDPTITSFPYIIDFNGETFPPTNWTNATGVLGENTVLTGTTSAWYSATNFANLSTNSKGVKVNLYNEKKEWIITPPVDLGNGTIDYQLLLEIALTGYNNNNAVSMGIDDVFNVVISTDNGITWTSNNIIATYNNASNLPNTTTNVIIDLNNYSGVVKFGFYARRPSGSTPDIDLHIDNVQVRVAPILPIASLNVGTKNFGNTLNGTEYNVFNFTISNTGPGILEIQDGDISIVGTDANQFSLDRDIEYPINLATNETAQIPVTFAPTSEGEKTATLKIESNASNSPTEAALSGTGVRPLTALNENFDAVTTPALPAYWSSLNTTGSTFATVTTTTTGNSAPNHVSLYNSGATTGSLLLITPGISDISGKRVKFFAKGGVGFTVVVGTMSNPNDANTFTEIETKTITATYAQYSVNIPTTQNKFIAFKHGFGSTYRYIYIDDVLMETPQALPPVPVTLVYPQDARILMHNPLLSWTPSTTGEPATGYKVYFNGTEVADVTTTTWQSANLLPSTQYTWYVVPYNTHGEQTTGNTTRSFSTIGANQLAQNFEETTIPVGWSADASTWATITTTPLFEGARSIYVSTGTTAIDAATAKKLITPLVTVGPNSTLNFYARTASTTGTQNIVIKHSQDGTNWTDFTSVTVPQTNWGNIIVDLSPLYNVTRTNNYYLAFGAFASASASIYVDYAIGPDMTPVLPGVVAYIAPSPANEATNVTITPTFTWSNPTTGGVPLGYKLYAGASQNSLTLIGATTTNTVSIPAETPLAYNFTYYWQVRPFNAAGEQTGSDIRSFTTMANPTIVAFPHNESFEGTNFPPNGWTNVKVGGPSTPGIWDLQTAGTSPTCTPQDATKMIRYNAFSLQAGTIGKLTTPNIVFPSGDFRVKFWMYHDPGYLPTAPALGDIVDVYYGSNQTSLGTFQRYAATAGWIQHEIVLPVAENGETSTISFVATSAYGNNIFLDNITIEEIPAVAVFSVTPNTYSFGNVEMNTTTQAQTFTISNLGGSDLGIVNVTLTGANADQFTKTDANVYPLTILPNGNITLTVAFNPTSAGNKTATLVITDNLNRVVNEVPLSGTGVDPVIYTLPYTQNFDGQQTLIGWKSYASATGDDARPWIISNSTNIGAYSGTNFVGVFYHSTNPKNEWLVTAPVILTAGTKYRVKFMVKAPGWDGTPEKLKVTVADSNTLVGISAGSIIWDDANMLIDAYTEKSASFTPTVSSTYYFSWHAYSDADNDYIAVDDITIEALNSPTNLQANVSNTNVTLTWNAPAVRSNVLKELIADNAKQTQNYNFGFATSKEIMIKENSFNRKAVYTNNNSSTRNISGYNVYRGETLLTSTPLAIDVLTYTDSNVADGTYTYKVVAVYGTDESIPATVQATVTSGTTLNIDLYAGWNILSINVVPANNDIEEIFATLRNAGKLIQVVDEMGNGYMYDEMLEMWTNDIYTIETAKGYHVEVSEDCQLSVAGANVALPVSLPLYGGWNMIGCPYANQVELASVVAALQDAGVLVQVVDEMGNGYMYDEMLEMWTDDIMNMIPGEGYHIEVSQDCTIEFLPLAPVPSPIRNYHIKRSNTSIRSSK